MIGRSALTEDFWRHGRSDACPVIDMHGHMGRWRGIWFPNAQPEAMVRTMDRCGVRLLAFCHHAALFCPEIGNDASIQAARRFPDRFRAYMAVNPNHGDAVAADLTRFQDHADVFIGLKLLSDYHATPWSAPAYEPAWAFADRRGLAVLGHTWGGSALDGQDQVRHIAERYPNVRLILGHSLHGAWDDAVAIAKAHANVWLELTAVLDDRGVLEKFVAAGLSERLLFGTDLPWFDPHHGIGAVLSAEISDDDRHNILHRNAERLLAELGAALP